MIEINFKDTNQLLNKSDYCKIIIKHAGVEVFVNDEERTRFDGADDVCREFIRQLIDFDEWKHSYHVNLDNLTYRSELKSGIWQILLDKIAKRQKEIALFKKGLSLLRRLNHLNFKTTLN